MEIEHYSESSCDSSSIHVTDDIGIVRQKSRRKSSSKPISSLSSSILIGFTSKLQTHEWLLGFGAVIAMYLVNGSFASSVCSLATCIPAVIHSYRVITEEKDNLLAHQITLCYWILLGSMSIFDFFIGDVFCYYFGKFMLMTSVYAHVVGKTRPPKLPARSQISQSSLTEQLYSEGESTAPTQDVTVQNPIQCSSVTSDYTILSSAGPLTSKNSSLENYMQWTKKNNQAPTSALYHSPISAVSTKTDSASDTLIAEKSPTPTVFSVHESDQPKPSIPQPSGDAESNTATFPSATSYFGEMPLKNSSTVSSFNEAPLGSTTTDESTLRNRVNAPRKLHRHEHTSISSTDWSRTPIRSGRQSIISQRRASNETSMLSSIKSVETLPCYENDLSSDPYHTINFKSPFNQNVNLTVTNVTTNRIMWALKTNAMDRIIATPTCGFLPAGNTIHIKMAIREKSQVHPADSARDRMAIDYVFVPEECVAFDPSRILAKNADARRKSFDINYVF